MASPVVQDVPLTEEKGSHTDDIKPYDTNEKVQDNSASEESAFLLQGWQLQTLMLGLCCSMLLVGLDFTMVATAVPTITTHFNSLKDVSWYGSSFMIAICACQLLAGNFFERFPHKWVYMSYVVVFEVGSLVSALAPSSIALIIGRAITGIGASGLLCGTLVVIASVAPKKNQPVYMGVVQSMYILAEVIGPIIGGAFTEHVTWRWCFWINMPVGGLTLLTLLLFVNSRTHAIESRTVMERFKSLDILGFILFSGSVVQLLLALQWGGVTFSWNSSVVIGLFVGFGTTLIAFILWQLHLGEKASVPPSIIKTRTVFFGFFVAVFGNGGFFVILYYLQIWFQAVKGASPLRSGIMYLPTVIADILTTVIGSGLIAQTPFYNPFLLFGLICLSIGAGLDTTLQVDSSHSKWIGFQILCGIGFSLLVQVPIVACQRDLAPTKIPMGTTIIILGQSFSAAMWVAVGQPVFESVLKSNLLKNVSLTVANQVIEAGATGFRAVVSIDQVPAIRQAYNRACTRVFFIAVACAIASFIFACGMKWKRQPKPVKKDKKDSNEETA